MEAVMGRDVQAVVDGSQQHQLLQMFPKKMVKTLPGRGGSATYVSWTDKIQRIIQVLGGFDWTIESVYMDSGDKEEPRAVHGRLVATVDGRPRIVDGIGQGRDFKTAETDSFARACSKLGVGLHLWCGGGDKDGGFWILSIDGETQAAMPADSNDTRPFSEES